nr:MAG TPA: hypothetical protein [Caudoviricetes sp.]
MCFDSLNQVNYPLFLEFPLKIKSLSHVRCKS